MYIYNINFINNIIFIYLFMCTYKYKYILAYLSRLIYSNIINTIMYY